MVGTGARGGGAMMLLGAALLLLSLTIFGYSRFVEWQHATQLQVVAPLHEDLPDTLAIPTPRTQQP